MKQQKDPYGVPLFLQVAKVCGKTARECKGFVGQGLQDLIMYSAVWHHQSSPGVYIDLAANDHRFISNSFFLDHCLQWSGVCIEANTLYYSGLQVNRSCAVEQKCVAEKEKQVTFNMASVWGGIDGQE